MFYAKRRSVKIEIFQISILRVERYCFEAKLTLRITWREPALDDVLIKNDTNFYSYWNPQIMITNIVGKLQVESLIEADINTSLETYLSETKFFHGVFKTTLMMATFPFDVYKLHFIVQSKLDDSQVTFLFPNQSFIGKGAQSFLIQGEYILNDMYRMFYHEEEIPSRVTEAKQALRITVMIKRKIISFVGKYSRLFFLYLVSLITLTMDPRLYLEERVKLSMGIFLVTALNCHTYDRRHNFPVLTIQNLYFLVMLYNNLFIVFYHCTINLAIGLVSSKREGVKISDTTVLIVNLVSMILFHIVLIARIFSRLNKKWQYFNNPESSVSSNEESLSLERR